MIKNIITLIVSIIITLAFYIGPILALWFFDLNYLWFGVPKAIHYIGTKFENIPILSYYTRVFNWNIIKFDIIKKLDKSGYGFNPETLALKLDFEKSDGLKKIYIEQGIQAFRDHVERIISEAHERTKIISSELQSIASNIHNSLEKGESQENVEGKIETDISKILPKNPELIKSVSSLLIQVEKDKSELMKLKESGVSDEGLQRLAFEKMISNFRSLGNVDKEAKQNLSQEQKPKQDGNNPE